MALDGAEAWAQEQFKNADLGDIRRTQRLVQVATSMAACPASSLPQQMVQWADLKAAYRLFDRNEVTFQAVGAAHYQRRYEYDNKRCLIISDTTEINFNWRRQIPDLGPLGKGQGYGFLLHSALILSSTGSVLGLAGQQLMCRRKKSKKITRTQALKQVRESQLWTQVISAVGTPPAGTQWVHVADRGADNFEVYHACQQYECDWIIRARCLKRKLLFPEERVESLQVALNQFQRLGELTLPIRFRKKRARDAERPAHTALLEVSVGTCQMPPPRLRSPELKQQEISPIPMQVICVNEVDPPDPKAAIRWVLYTSLPVETFEQAQEVIESYTHRWKIEEWHKCLKTGCSVTSRQLQTRDRLEPLIALLSVQAVRLLQLRDLARNQPDTPASQHVPRLYLQVLQMQTKQNSPKMTVRTFVRTVAGLGGFLKRKHDGEPGWQTIWRGWQKLITLTQGYQLANQPP